MQDDFDDRRSLKDLDGVRVVIDAMSRWPQGLSPEMVQREVEDRLRVNRVPLLGAGKFPTGDPHLRVTVVAAAPDSGMAACHVQVDFAQIVFLRRNPAVTFNQAQTWRAQTALVLAPANRDFPSAVRQEIARQVDQFVRDYHAANP